MKTVPRDFAVRWGPLAGSAAGDNGAEGLHGRKQEGRLGEAFNRLNDVNNTPASGTVEDRTLWESGDRDFEI